MLSAALKSEHFGVHLRLLGMALLWGGSWPAGRVVAQHMAPLASSALRFVLVVLILGVWLYKKHKGFASLLALTTRQRIALIVAGAIGVFGYTFCFMTAMQTVPASRAALVVTTNPVFTTLLAAWLFKERFNWKVAAGMALAFMGAVIVLTKGAPLKLLQGDLSRGDLLLLGCIACWVVYTLLNRATLRNVDSLTATTCTALVGLVLFWPASLMLEGDAVWQGVPGSALFSLLFLAIGSTVLAYVWYNEGIAKLGAGVASSYISIVPVFGVIAATLWLREPVDASLLLGGALSVAGLVMMNYARR